MNDNIAIKRVSGSVLECPDEIRFPVTRSYYGRVQINNMAICDNILYAGVFGGDLMAYDMAEKKILWEDYEWQGFGKTLVVKGDFLYAISSSQMELVKRNRHSGEVVARKKEETIIGYNKSVICSLDGVLYTYSSLTQTLYRVDDQTLEFTPSGIENGAIVAFDCDVDLVAMYTRAHHLLKFDSALQFIADVDLSAVTKIVDEQPKHVVCSRFNRGISFVQGGMYKKKSIAVRNDAKNVDDAFVHDSGWAGKMLCFTKSMNVGDQLLFNAGTVTDASRVLVTANTVLYNEWGTCSVLPYTITNAFNIDNTLYMCLVDPQNVVIKRV